MKILIIEGPDNCGKDTAIHQLMSKFYKTKIIHSQKPKSSDPVDALNEQYDLFLNQYKDAYFDYMMDSEDILIFNRAWYGEYVYGQIYRNENSASVIELVNDIEDQFIYSEGLDLNDVLYVQLMVDNYDFLCNNDDGLSLSKNNKELIEKECNMFKEIFEHSKFNKTIINVNDGTSFRPKEDIMKEIYDALNI